MKTGEILKECEGLRIFEERESADGYSELVFYTEDSDRWIKALGERLGYPRKPQGQKPTRDDLVLTKPYGGIHENQILFKKQLENGILFAMLWPWQDGTHTTLKIAFKEVSQ